MQGDAFNPLPGLLLYVLASLPGALFYLLFRRVHEWAWESYHLVYAVFGMLVLPLLFALTVAPGFLNVLRETPTQTLAVCFAGGALWAAGSFLWTHAVGLVGVGRALAIGGAVSAVAGAFIPAAMRGRLGDLFSSFPGWVTLGGVLVAGAGIMVSGWASALRDRSASASPKGEKVGLALAALAGLLSAGMVVGLRSGASIEQAALRAGIPELWQGIPVFVVVLLGAFLVSLIWCLYHNVRNHSAGDYNRVDAPLLRNMILCALAGVLWCSQFVIFQAADVNAGKLDAAGWAAFMGSWVVFQSGVGLVSGAWKGANARSWRWLLAGTALVLGALMLFAWAGKLMAEGSAMTLRPPAADTNAAPALPKP